MDMETISGCLLSQMLQWISLYATLAHSCERISKTSPWKWDFWGQRVWAFNISKDITKLDSLICKCVLLGENVLD